MLILHSNKRIDNILASKNWELNPYNLENFHAPKIAESRSKLTPLNLKILEYKSQPNSA